MIDALQTALKLKVVLDNGQVLTHKECLVTSNEDNDLIVYDSETIDGVVYFHISTIYFGVKIAYISMNRASKLKKELKRNEDGIIYYISEKQEKKTDEQRRD